MLEPGKVQMQKSNKVKTMAIPQKIGARRLQS
jgi:hypothetical protein